MEKLINEKIQDWQDCAYRCYNGENQSPEILIKAIISDLKEIESALQQTKSAPVEVPEFVAEWFKLHENDLEFRIWKFIYDYNDHDKEKKFYKWFNNSDNKPIETLIKMKDGYTVAKEPEEEEIEK